MHLKSAKVMAVPYKPMWPIKYNNNNNVFCRYSTHAKLKFVSIVKLLWSKRNKSCQDMLVLENNELQYVLSITSPWSVLILLKQHAPSCFISTPYKLHYLLYLSLNEKKRVWMLLVMIDMLVKVCVCTQHRQWVLLSCVTQTHLFITQ